MTDLRNLGDAFAELERRADVATARMSDALPRRTSRPVSRLVPVAVAAAVVAGLATGVALLAPGEDAGTRVAASSTGVSTPPPSSASPIGVAVPATPEELELRFRKVLADTATFTVTDNGSPAQTSLPPGPTTGAQTPPAPDPTRPGPDPTPSGAAIVGILTAGGVSGGYDLQIYGGDAGEQAQCGGGAVACDTRPLPDGSSLAVSTLDLMEGDPTGVTYEVLLVHPDGVTLLMHLSNLPDPKGAGVALAPQPPLTTEELIEVVTSDRW